MKRVVWMMHVSLDGFVTDPNGNIDWAKVDEKMFDYAGERTDNADIALYGRKTFDIMDAYWPTAADKPNPSRHSVHHSAWYKQVHKVIVSKTLQGKQLPNTTIISDDIVGEITKLKQGDGKDIVIFGSPSIGQQLVAAGLVDDLWLFVNPILLGEGLPLFKGIKDRTQLKLVYSYAFDYGVVCLRYEKA